VEGSDYVEALAGTVDKAGEVAACGAVREGQRELEWFYPGGEEVDGHAYLGAEAGGDAGRISRAGASSARWPESGSEGA
jgi:hypothetical protein